MIATNCETNWTAAKFLWQSLPWITAVLIGIILTETSTALEIELSYFDGFENRPAARAAIEHAAEIWENLLVDPVTIQIDVFEFSDPNVPDDVLGGTSVTYDFIDYDYVQFREALASDATSSDDSQAVAHLQAGPKLTFRSWDADQNGVLLGGDEWINQYVSPVRAVAKALGLPHDDDGPDAEIHWNTPYLENGFDFDRSDDIDGTDFVAAAMHEIGHALGFSSGVDFIDLVLAGETPIPPELLPELPVVEALDLFRYSAQSLPHLDLVPAGDPYFSIDGGATNLGAFASGEFFGDGNQPSHWQGGSGLMDASGEDDVIHNLTPLDLRAMDVIGWDLAVVPEPSTGVALLMGMTIWSLAVDRLFPCQNV